MASEDEKKRSPSAKTKGRSGTQSKAGEGAVGNALRSVYQQAVREDVPGEMLDLLGKLT